MMRGGKFVILTLSCLISVAGNLAYKKTTKQFGQYLNQSSDLAVDGIIPYQNDSKCAHPYHMDGCSSKHFAWWEVDLGDFFVVQEIFLYNPYGENNRKRMYGYDIRVANDTEAFSGGELCYTAAASYDTIEPSHKYHFSCIEPIVGRYVNIRRTNEYQSACMTICEFVVKGYKACSQGYYGVACSKSCQGCRIGCHVVTGKCFGGCLPFYLNAMCDFEIPRIDCNVSSNEYNVTVAEVSNSSVTLSWLQDDAVLPNMMLYYEYNVEYKVSGNNKQWIRYDTVKHLSTDVYHRLAEPRQITILGLESGVGYEFHIIPCRVHEEDKDCGTPSKSIYQKTNGYTNSEPEGLNLLTVILSVVAVVLIFLCLTILILIGIKSRKAKAKETKFNNNVFNNGVSTKIKDDQVSIEVCIPTNTSKTCAVTQTAVQNSPISRVTTTSLSITELRKLTLDGLKRSDRVHTEFTMLPLFENEPCTVASQELNVDKNRFKNIRAYDQNRVLLQGRTSDQSDYINASYISKCGENSAKYIATQGPRPNTVDDFWQMVWQEDVSTIIMLTGLMEDGKIKCQQYWPSEINSKSDYGTFGVKMLACENYADYSLRIFCIENKSEEKKRKVKQIHCHSWSDNMRPTDTISLLDFLRRVRSLNSKDKGHLLVHCSAGVGRTGTFIALDTLMHQAEQTPQSVDVFTCVSKLRSERMNMVQTESQYAFLYDALADYFTCRFTNIPSLELEKFLLGEHGKSSDDEIQRQYELLQQKRQQILTTTNLISLDTTDSRAIYYNGGSNFVDGVQSSPGIVAKKLKGFYLREEYIVVSQPIPEMIEGFWSLVHENNSKTVICMNCEGPIALSTKSLNGCIYWPDDKQVPLSAGSLSVQLIFKHQISPSVIKRQLRLSATNGPGGCSDITHFELLSWKPDLEVPSNPKDVLDIIDELSSRPPASQSGPIILQCCDGVGQSPVMAAGLRQIEMLKVEREVDVFYNCQSILADCPLAFRSIDQYRFLYQLALQYIRQYDNYANFK